MLKSIWHFLKPWPTLRYSSTWKNNRQLLEGISGGMDAILITIAVVYLGFSMHVLNWTMHHVFYVVWNKYVLSRFGNGSVMKVIDLIILGLVALLFWIYLIMMGYRLHQLTRKHTVKRIDAHNERVAEIERAERIQRDTTDG